MVDTMATRYGMLPSEVLCRADSLDVLFMDVAMQYHNAQMEKARSKAEGGSGTPIQSIPQEQLTAMMNKVRGTDK